MNKITNHFSGTLSELDRVVVKSVKPGGNWRDLPEDFPSRRIQQIRRTAAAGQGSRSTYYGRLIWDKPSYTISTLFNRPGNGCFIHPEAERLITVREASRLQSFPDAYVLGGKPRSRFTQIGNAVPPLLAFELAKMIPSGTMVDLFSGCGGLSLGFEWAGFQTIAGADINVSANETFAMNRPMNDMPIDLDLSDSDEHRVAIKEIQRRLNGSRLDLLAGGPPCQGFSTAGNCLPDDPRNKLVYSFVKAVEELKPRHIVMENVSALLFRRGTSILKDVVRQFRGLGYEVSIAIVHAEAYGVPQLRRRMILIAGRNLPDWPQSKYSIIAPAHFRLQPGKIFENKVPNSVHDAIGDLLNEETEVDRLITYRSNTFSKFQQLMRGEISPVQFSGKTIPASPFHITSELFPEGE